jgi:peptidoglycan-N-acetylglucosamine deacetylase
VRLTRYHCILGAACLAAALVLLLTKGTWSVALLGLLFSLAGLLIGLGVSFPQWQMFGVSLCRVRTEQRVVALTFDDGPDPASSPVLLELLGRRRVVATFFCVGEGVARYPELARRMAGEGHQVENHSQGHSGWFNLFSLQCLRTEIKEAQEQICQATGRAPTLFRPPMGLTNPRVFRVAGELGLRVAGYSVRGFDLRPDEPEKIVGRLMRGVRPGAILLLHDGGVPAARLASVVNLLLDKLDDQGYRCLRLDKLVACEDASAAQSQPDKNHEICSKKN